MAPALWASSVWESACFDDAHRRATSLRADEFYGRYANPTVRAFEQAIAELEGADDAMAFASGMGAIATTVLALCSSGDHVVATKQLYAGTIAFLQGPCRRFGIDLTLVDATEPGALAAAVRPGRTTVVIAETPSNPRLELVDLDELGSIAGTVHDRRLHVRDPARAAAARARRRSGRALGDQGHRRAQRRHDRRRRGRT
jgi:cystathionine beta-lyase/cystathionine gamma-synthase